MNPHDIRPFELPIETINKYVKSTRIRAGRSIEGYSLPAFTTEYERNEVEKQLKLCFQAFEYYPTLKGKYFELGSMTREEKNQLRAAGILFKDPNDRTLLKAAGADRLWPKNRGIFCADSKKFFVWVNEEDHMRAFAMGEGGNIMNVYQQWQQGIEKIDQILWCKQKKFL